MTEQEERELWELYNSVPQNNYVEPTAEERYKSEREYIENRILLSEGHK